jgi:hypothetical protein
MSYIQFSISERLRPGNSRTDLEFSSRVWCVRRIHIEKLGNAASDICLDTFIFMKDQTWCDKVFSNGGERGQINILRLRVGDGRQFIEESLSKTSL